MALFKYFQHADALPPQSTQLPAEVVKVVNEQVKKQLDKGLKRGYYLKVKRLP